MSKEKIYVVTGISCDGCGGSVTNAIQEVEGEASVAVILEIGRAVRRGRRRL